MDTPEPLYYEDGTPTNTFGTFDSDGSLLEFTSDGSLIEATSATGEPIEIEPGRYQWDVDSGRLQDLDAPVYEYEPTVEDQMTTAVNAALEQRFGQQQVIPAPGVIIETNYDVLDRRFSAEFEDLQAERGGLRHTQREKRLLMAEAFADLDRGGSGSLRAANERLISLGQLQKVDPNNDDHRHRWGDELIAEAGRIERSAQHGGDDDFRTEREPARQTVFNADVDAERHEAEALMLAGHEDITLYNGGNEQLKPAEDFNEEDWMPDTYDYEGAAS